MKNIKKLMKENSEKSIIAFNLVVINISKIDW